MAHLAARVDARAMPTTHITAAAVGAVAIALGAAGTAHAQRTLTLDMPCYSPGDVVEVTGSGWNPDMDVAITYGARGLLVTNVRTDSQGGLLSRAMLEPEHYRELAGGLDPEPVTVGVAASEQSGNPEDAAFASTLVSPFGVFTTRDPGRLRKRMRMGVGVRGFTGLAGSRIYLHYLRNGLRVASVPVATLRGPCGNADARLRMFAFRGARPGAYDLVFNTSRTSHGMQPAAVLRARLRRR